MDGTSAFRKSAGAFAVDCHKSPDYRELAPLRIPAGWTIGWNTLHRDKRAENGDFGGSSVFLASNHNQRFFIDVEFRPEHDPEGSFHLHVEYEPWPRDERGRRRIGLPVQQSAATRRMHSFETRSFDELVEHLETWIARCSIWTVEGN